MPIKLAFDSIAIKKAASIYRAVYHPFRFQIIELINKAGRLNVTPIVRKFNMEQSLVSAHLKILRDARFLTTEREGQQIFYSVNYERLNFVSTFAEQLMPHLPVSQVIHPSSKLKSKPGTKGLTPKELKIITLVCQQKTSGEIGQSMQLSKRTVEDYRTNILKKTGAKNSVGILIYALKNGLFKLK